MKYRLGFWFASVFVGCSSPSPSTSSSSNWVACTKVSDCSAAPGAVDCTGGYCVDANGNRVSGSGASSSGGASTGGASSGGSGTGGTPSGGAGGASTGGGDGGVNSGGTSSGGVGTGGFTTGGSHSGGAATGGGDSGVFTSCAACADGYFCFQWNNSSLVTCRPFAGSCDAGPTCVCACPDIGAGDCGGGTTGCTCTVTSGKVEVHCSGA